MRVFGEKEFQSKELDLKDRKLLYYLNQNYRITIAMLSELLKLSRETVKYRFERLKKEGIITGSVTVLNANEIGNVFSCILFQFHRLGREKENEFIEYLIKQPFTFRIIKTSGKWDLMVWYVYKDVFEFNKISRECRNRCQDFLKDFEFVDLLSEYKFVSTPTGVLDIEDERISFRKQDSSFGKELQKMKIELPGEIRHKKIDKLDLDILKEIDKNCRISLKELSDKFDCSIEKITYRIKRLIQENILQAFWPLISVSKLGFQWYLLLIQLQNITPEKEKELEIFCKNHKYIVWANRLNGKWDMLVDINARSLEHFSSIIDEFREKFSDIILDYDSVLMLKEFKYSFFSETFYDATK